MDSVKGKEEVQNSTASTTSSSSETKTQQQDSVSSVTFDSKSGDVKDDCSGDVGSTTVDSAQTPPSSSSPISESTVESQATKRVKELSTATLNDPSSSDDSPKAKKVRKDDETSCGTDMDASPCTTTQYVDKEKDGDSNEPGSGRSSVDSALKVPPIKIVFQGHTGLGTSQAESVNTVAQPHVVTTTAAVPFPYIVSSADSSGIPDSSVLNTKDKNETVQPKATSDQLLEVGRDKQREVGSSCNDSPKSSVVTDAAESTKSNEGISTNLILDDRSAIDGTQSPSLLGKEKPTRVTRSSQRIATTVQASPATSPKTSTCSSPTQLDGNNPVAAEVISSIAQESGPECSPVPVKTQDPPELHPRKRKLKGKEKEKDKDKDKDREKDKDGKESVKDLPLPPSSAVSSSSSTSGEGGEGPGTQTPGSNPSEPPCPTLNCVEMYLNIRKQVEKRRQSLFPVQPKPPQGFKDYLMNRGTYVLSTTPNAHMAVPSNALPPTLPPPLKELFVEQEKERHRLRLQQVVEKEKLVLSVEQEILRVHGRAARALSNQAVPFSVCTFLKDEEVYNLVVPEQEEKPEDTNSIRSRYNGRLFLSWLQDVDDKWEKIKEAMVLRHHNEAESLYAVQKMDWEWKMKEVGLCEPKATPLVDEFSVPMVFVSDEFDLLPA